MQEQAADPIISPSVEASEAAAKPLFDDGTGQYYVVYHNPPTRDYYRRGDRIYVDDPKAPTRWLVEPHDSTYAMPVAGFVQFITL